MAHQAWIRACSDQTLGEIWEFVSLVTLYKIVNVQEIELFWELFFRELSARQDYASYCTHAAPGIAVIASASSMASSFSISDWRRDSLAFLACSSKDTTMYSI